MGSYYMGFYYDMPKRGRGYSLNIKNQYSRGSLNIYKITKKSALEIIKQTGFNVDDESVTLTKNTD